MNTRPLQAILIGIVVSLAAGTVLAQRPLNVPNYLLSSTPMLPLNTPVDGRLDSDDGQNFKDGAYVDVYTFDGTAGEEVVLLLGSAVFDTYLSLFSPSGELVDWSDDLANTSDSGLDVFLPETGRYLVVVSSFFGGATGDYTVTRYTPDQAPMEVFEDLLDDFPLGGPDHGALPPSQILSVPTSVSGALSADTAPIDIDGWSHYVQTFDFALGETRLVEIAMRSDEFDAYLYLFDESGELIASNDDDPGGFDTDSRIAQTLEPGSYTVVATSFFELESGGYELEIQLFQPAD